MRAARFGATWVILDRKYSCNSCLYCVRDTTRLEKTLNVDQVNGRDIHALKKKIV